jgi:hypothetical protein
MEPHGQLAGGRFWLGLFDWTGLELLLWSSLKWANLSTLKWVIAQGEPGLGWVLRASLTML